MWSNYILLAFVLLTLMTLSSSKVPVSPLNQGENGKTTQPSEEQGGARDHMPKWWAWLEVGEEPSGLLMGRWGARHRWGAEVQPSPPRAHFGWLLASGGSVDRTEREELLRTQLPKVQTWDWNGLMMACLGTCERTLWSIHLVFVIISLVVRPSHFWGMLLWCA